MKWSSLVSNLWKGNAKDENNVNTSSNNSSPRSGSYSQSDSSSPSSDEESKLYDMERLTTAWNRCNVTIAHNKHKHSYPANKVMGVLKKENERNAKFISILESFVADPNIIKKIIEQITDQLLNAAQHFYEISSASKAPSTFLLTKQRSKVLNNQNSHEVYPLIVEYETDTIEITYTINVIGQLEKPSKTNTETSCLTEPEYYPHNMPVAQITNQLKFEKHEHYVKITKNYQWHEISKGTTEKFFDGSPEPYQAGNIIPLNCDASHNELPGGNKDEVTINRASSFKIESDYFDEKGSAVVSNNSADITPISADTINQSQPQLPSDMLECIRLALQYLVDEKTVPEEMHEKLFTFIKQANGKELKPFIYSPISLKESDSSEKEFIREKISTTWFELIQQKNNTLIIDDFCHLKNPASSLLKRINFYITGKNETDNILSIESSNLILKDREELKPQDFFKEHLQKKEKETWDISDEIDDANKLNQLNEIDGENSDVKNPVLNPEKMGSKLTANPIAISKINNSYEKILSQQTYQKSLIKLSTIEENSKLPIKVADRKKINEITARQIINHSTVKPKAENLRLITEVKKGQLSEDEISLQELSASNKKLKQVLVRLNSDLNELQKQSNNSELIDNIEEMEGIDEEASKLLNEIAKKQKEITEKERELKSNKQMLQEIRYRQLHETLFPLPLSALQEQITKAKQDLNELKNKLNESGNETTKSQNLSLNVTKEIQKKKDQIKMMEKIQASKKQQEAFKAVYEKPSENILLSPQVESSLPKDYFQKQPIIDRRKQRVSQHAEQTGEVSNNNNDNTTRMSNR